MKRKYKPGDWFVVRLHAQADAAGVITRMCRSRLFGYFFAIPPGSTPSPDRLRAFGHGGAFAYALFGGAPLEDARWEMLATSLVFDENAWPFPDFGARGAFARSWTRVRYDPHTLQIAERTPTDARTARALPDARIATAEQLESQLRAALAGSIAAHPNAVCEIRSPVHFVRLAEELTAGGRVQFSSMLTAGEFDELAALLSERSNIALRVHGFAHGFDARMLRRFGALRALQLDCRALQHAQALADLPAVQRLEIGPLSLDLSFLLQMSRVRELVLRGTRGALQPVEGLSSLRTLVLSHTEPLNLRALTSHEHLQSLTLAHGGYDLRAIGEFKQLRELELHALDIAQLPRLCGLRNLQRVRLRALRRITDISELALVENLRELRIEEMPQLNVGDFAALQQRPPARCEVDVGSRSKERAIARLLRAGAGPPTERREPQG